MKLTQLRAAVTAVALTASTAAMAALPAAATDAFEAVETNVTDILGAVWPIVALSVGGFILIKLFKKGANKAV